MSREIRRVPLDFDWPLHKPWDGFINTQGRPCPEEGKTCFGGDTAAMTWLASIARLVALVGEEAVSEPHADALRARGRLYPHPYLVEWPQAPRTSDGKLHPFGGEELVALVTGLGGKRPHMLLGSGNQWQIMKALMKAAGLPEGWGRCPVCGGEGSDPASRAAADAWKSTPPPEGPGWQLWETVSEGSPISPVFPNEAAFGRYLLGQGYSPKAVEEFIRLGWCMSGVGTVTEGPDGPVFVSIRENIESLGDE